MTDSQELSDDDLLNISSLIQAPLDNLSVEDELLSLDGVYSERKFLAKGGFKKIECARDNATDRIIALATPLEKGDSVRREAFLREARLLATLQHPNIIPLYAIGFVDESTPCFSMKLIQGEGFDEFMKTNDD